MLSCQYPPGSILSRISNIHWEANMKALRNIILTSLALVLIGCSDKPTRSAQPAALPTPVLVNWSSIPSGSSATLYEVTSRALLESPEPLLKKIISSGFVMNRAWYPQTTPCAVVFLEKSLIVELQAPNSNIESLGFVRDTATSHSGCWRGWDEYDFRSASTSGDD